MLAIPKFIPTSSFRENGRQCWAIPIYTFFLVEKILKKKKKETSSVLALYTTQIKNRSHKHYHEYCRKYYTELTYES